MTGFIESHRRRFGVEPICRVMEFDPSTYWAVRSRPLSDRSVRDEGLRPEIERVHKENYGIYGAHKVWKQMDREGFGVARYTAACLMRDLGLRGVRRGRKVRTTVPDETAARPADLVCRLFAAARPDQLWVADLTYVRTWAGFCYAAFVIDVFSRMIVGWSLSTSLKTGMPWRRWRWRCGAAAVRFPGWCITLAVRMNLPVASWRPDPHSDRPIMDDRAGEPSGGLTRTLIDQPCHSPDLSAARGFRQGC